MQSISDKNFGAQWLGSAPEDWRQVRAKHIMRERRERSLANDIHLTPSQKYAVLPQAEYMKLTGGRVVLNLTGADSMKHVEAGDFIIHLRSFQGGIEYSKYTGKVSNAYTVLTPGSEIVDSFYKYIFKSEGFISELSHTTDQLRDGQSIKFSQLDLITFPLPPEGDQRKIADYLDVETAKIDNLIAKQRRLLELLEEKRRATITHAVTRGLNPNVELKETNIPWLGKIPASGRIMKLKMMLLLNTGGVWGDDPHNDGSDIIVLRSTEQTVDGAWVLHNPAERHITIGEYEKTKLREGDLVVTKSSGSELHIGKTSIVDAQTTGYSYSNFMQRLRFKDSETPEFYWYLLNSNVARGQYNYYSNSTSGLANLNSTIFDELQFVHFNPAEQQAIVRYLAEEDRKLITLKQKIKKQIVLLCERRTSLVSYAVTGKVKV